MLNMMLRTLIVCFES